MQTLFLKKYNLKYFYFFFNNKINNFFVLNKEFFF